MALPYVVVELRRASWTLLRNQNGLGDESVNIFQDD